MTLSFLTNAFQCLTSTANFRRSYRPIYFSTVSLVADKTIGGATPLSNACFHREAQRHHLSRGFKPGNPYVSFGLDKSFPRSRVKLKNSSVTSLQTPCTPMSCSAVWQLPFRLKPVSGDRLHVSNGVPITFLSDLILYCPQSL